MKLEYSDEIADVFLTQLSDGKSMKSVCEMMNVKRHVIWRWLRENEEFKKLYELAKRESADAIEDEILDIADDNKDDIIETGNGILLNRVAVDRAKLRVDSRKWVAAKRNPQKYSDKSEQKVEHSGGVSIVMDFSGDNS